MKSFKKYFCKVICSSDEGSRFWVGSSLIDLRSDNFLRSIAEETNDKK